MSKEQKYAEMVAALAKPGQAILDSLTPERADLLHMAVGVAGETGELLSAVYTALAQGTEIDAKNFIEELGDIEFYSKGIETSTGVSSPVAPEVEDFDPDTPILHIVIEASIAGTDVLDAVKRLVIYEKQGVEDKLLESLVRLHRSLASARAYIGVDRERVLGVNTEKLSARYHSGTYSNQQAIERSDESK